MACTGKTGRGGRTGGERLSTAPGRGTRRNGDALGSTPFIIEDTVRMRAENDSAEEHTEGLPRSGYKLRDGGGENTAQPERGPGAGGRSTGIDRVVPGCPLTGSFATDAGMATSATAPQASWRAFFQEGMTSAYSSGNRACPPPRNDSMRAM